MRRIQSQGQAEGGTGGGYTPFSYWTQTSDREDRVQCGVLTDVASAEQRQVGGAAGTSEWPVTDPSLVTPAREQEPER